MGLIAKVAVLTMVDGQRKEFQPGEELPELAPHDVEALKQMGAIEDTAETAKADKARKAEEKAAAKEFDTARAAVAAEQASIAPAA